MDWHAVDRRIAALSETAFGLLERLVEAGATGDEQRSAEILAAELTDLGFDVARVPLPPDIGAQPGAGVPTTATEDRWNVVGRRGPAHGPSLLLNGHLDVVPVERELWASDPFRPVRRDGWLHGRGAGDMKGGFAIGLLALTALDQLAPGWQTGPLTVVGAVEEESTGNGTLAACRDGALADAAVLLEPTDLGVLLGGVGIVWADVVVTGEAAHAEAADRSANPVAVLPALLEALDQLRDDLDAVHDPDFAEVEHPYNVNVGLLHAGSWRSSVPGALRVGVRIGHPRSMTAEAVLERVDELARAAAKLAGVAPDRVTVTPTGFRAQGHVIPAAHPLVQRLATAHRCAHGAEPALFTLGSTTDARFYLNQYGIPAVAYGARTRNIHGNDEAVELASIVDAARTMTRFLHDYYRDRPAMPRLSPGPA